MGDRDRPRRSQDRAVRGRIAAVRQIDEHAEAVHVADHCLAEQGEPAVDAFTKAVANSVALVVTQLQHPQPELVKLLQPLQIFVADGIDGGAEDRRVLRTQDDAEPAGRLRGNKIRTAPHEFEGRGALSRCVGPDSQRLFRLRRRARIDG